MQPSSPELGASLPAGHSNDPQRPDIYKKVGPTSQCRRSRGGFLLLRPIMINEGKMKTIKSKDIFKEQTEKVDVSRGNPES